jgi:hypothetical protein
VTSRVYGTVFTVPAGTPIAAPVSVAVALEDNTLDRVSVTVPDGHNGLTGLRITWGGTQVLPFAAGTWVTANGQVIDQELGQEITAGGLVLTGYNTGIYPHSFHVLWHISELAEAAGVTIVSAQAAAPSTAAIADVSQMTSTDQLGAADDTTGADLTGAPDVTEDGG